MNSTKDLTLFSSSKHCLSSFDNFLRRITAADGLKSCCILPQLLYCFFLLFLSMLAYSQMGKNREIGVRQTRACAIQ